MYFAVIYLLFDDPMKATTLVIVAKVQTRNGFSLQTVMFSISVALQYTRGYSKSANTSDRYTFLNLC